MNEQERIRLMTQLCLLEREHDREIRRAERTFRSDYIAANVLRALAFGLAAYLCAAAVLLIRHAQDLYRAAMDGELKMMITFAGGSLGLLLVICGITAFFYSRKTWAKAADALEQRNRLIQLLDVSQDTGLEMKSGKKVTG